MNRWTAWVTMGLAAIVAGWTLAGSAEANDRRVRDRRENVRDRREDVRERAGDVKTPEEREKARENTVDRREDRQARRIENGIEKGYLTPDEAAKLKAQQDSIASMEASFKGDGKLSRSEFKQLQDSLNTASRCIWAEKHDADGNVMPVYRLGKDVRVNNDVAQKLGDPNLSKEEARAFAKDFHLMLGCKHRLATADLTPAERARLQAQYNDLLNQYFYLVAETPTCKTK